ncbi:hypothetical protein ACRAWG_17165 [Methylobacterium sp. P31]
MKRILRDTVAAVIVVAGAATAFAQGGPGGGGAGGGAGGGLREAPQEVAQRAAGQAPQPEAPGAARGAEPRAACEDPAGVPRAERAARSPAERRSAAPRALAGPEAPAVSATAPRIGRVRERTALEPSGAVATPVPLVSAETATAVPDAAVNGARQANEVGEKVSTTAARHAAQ